MIANYCTFADNPVACLFNNIYFNIAGQCVSFISNGVPQIDQLKSRRTRNRAYNDSIGEAMGVNGLYHERMEQMFDMKDTGMAQMGGSVSSSDFDRIHKKFLSFLQVGLSLVQK